MSNKHKYNKQAVIPQDYDGTTFFKCKKILKKTKDTKSVLS